LVSSIAYYYAPKSPFTFFLAADGEEQDSQIGISHLPLARAVNAAIDRDVDVLNISAGRARPNCTHGQCVYCSEVRRAVENGIAVVASAGNDPDACVHCPSNAESALSVGGVEFVCEFSMPRAPGHPTNEPPQAYWTRLWSGYDDYPETAANRAYCTTRDCWMDGGGCSDHMKLEEWNHNPIPSSGKPDILAPVHFAAQFDEQYPFVWGASSFAAPVVSGCLAGILSTLESSPEPYTIRQAVRDGSTSTDPSIDGAIFDASSTKTHLLSDTP